MTDYEEYVALLREREGDQKKSYMDLDNLAFGYGSQATEEEAKRFPLGTSVPDDYREKRFGRDAISSWERAEEQAIELGIDPTSEMKRGLASANYQLGSNWLDEHVRTRDALSVGDWDLAAEEVGSSLWSNQTPRRVADFKKGLQSMGASVEVPPVSYASVEVPPVSYTDESYELPENVWSPAYEEDLVPEVEKAPEGMWRLDLPDNNWVNFKDDVSREDALEWSKKEYPRSFGIVPEPPPPPVEDVNMFEAFLGSGARAFFTIPSGFMSEYAIATDNQKLFDTAESIRKYGHEIGESIAPIAGMVSLDDVAKAWEEDAVEGALKYAEHVGEQLGTFTGYFAPAILASLAATYALPALGLGAMGTSAAASAATTVASRAAIAALAASRIKTAAAAARSTTQLGFYLGANIERGIQEGLLSPEDYNGFEQLGYAAGSAALDNLSFNIATGRGFVSKAAREALGKGTGKLSVGANATIARAYKSWQASVDTDGKIYRAVLGVLSETVGETGQQALERAAAGLPVANEDALDEYIEVWKMLVGPTLLTGGFGAAHASYQQHQEKRREEGYIDAKDEIVTGNRAAARSQLEDVERERVDELEVIAHQQNDLIDEVAAAQSTVTPQQIHDAADARNIRWDRDPGFSAFTSRILGKPIYHLDQITEPADLFKIYNAIRSLPVQQTKTSFNSASDADVIDVARRIYKDARGKKGKPKKPELTAARIKRALIATGKVDPKKFKKPAFDKLVKSYQSQMAKLGLLRTDTNSGKTFVKAGSPGEVRPNIPIDQYNNLINLAQEKNEFPTFKEFQDETGIINRDYYEDLIESAIARGDITESNGKLIPAPGRAQLQTKYAVTVNGVQETDLHNTLEAANRRGAEIAQAQTQERIDRSGTAQQGWTPRRIDRLVPSVQVTAVDVPRLSSEVVRTYEHPIKAAKKWVVTDSATGDVVGAYDTRKKADAKQSELQAQGTWVVYRDNVADRAFVSDVKNKRDKVTKNTADGFIDNSIKNAGLSARNAIYDAEGYTESAPGMSREEAQAQGIPSKGWVRGRGVVPQNVINKARVAQKRAESAEKKSLSKKKSGKLYGIEEQSGFTVHETSRTELEGKPQKPRIEGFFPTRAAANAAAQSLDRRTQAGDVGSLREVVSSLQEARRANPNLAQISDAELEKRLDEDPRAVAEEMYPVDEGNRTPAKSELMAEVEAIINREFPQPYMKGILVEILDPEHHDTGNAADKDSSFDWSANLIRLVMKEEHKYDIDTVTGEKKERTAKEIFDSLLGEFTHEKVHGFVRSGMMPKGVYKLFSQLALKKKYADSGLTYLEKAYQDYGPAPAGNNQGVEENWTPGDYMEEAVAFLIQDSNPAVVSGQAKASLNRLAKTLQSLRNMFRGLGYKTHEDIIVALYGNQHSNAVMRDKISDVHWINRHSTQEGQILLREIRDRTAITEDPTRIDEINAARARDADALELPLSPLVQGQTLSSDTIAKLRSRDPSIFDEDANVLRPIRAEGGGDDLVEEEGVAVVPTAPARPAVVGDTVTLYDPKGRPATAIVTAISDSGTKRLRVEGETEDILLGSKWSETDPSSSQHVIESIAIDGRNPLVSELTDEQLTALVERTADKIQAHKDARQITPSTYGLVRDLNAMKLEQRRRAESVSPEEGVPAVPAVPAAPVGDATPAPTEREETAAAIGRSIAEVEESLQRGYEQLPGGAEQLTPGRRAELTENLKRLRIYHANLSTPSEPGPSEEGVPDAARRYAVNRENRRMLRGTFAGTPQLRTEREIGAIRNSLLAATKRGAEGRFWYQQGARALLDYVGGDIGKYDKIAQLIALYSANKGVVGNLTVALQAWNQFISGKPITIGTRKQVEKANRLMYKNDTSALGKTKSWSFYQNMMHPIDPTRVDPDAVTVDIWMMRAFGYEPKFDKDGKRKAEKPTRAQYRFISEEVQRIAKKLGWRPYEVQAAIWVAAKAKGEGTPIGDAVATDWSSLLAKRLGQISYEAEPHPTTVHLTGLNRLPWRVRADYMKQISEAFLDGNGRDMLAYAINLLTPGSFFGVGAYESDITPGEQFQTFAVKRVGAKGLDHFKVSHEFKEVADLYAAARGLLMHQQAVAWTMPLWNEIKAPAKHRNMAVIDIRDGSTGELRAPTVQETSAIYEKIKEKTGYDDHAPISTGQGWWVNNLEYIQDKGLDNKKFQKLIRSAIEDFDSELDVNVSFIPSDTGFIENDWSTKPDGEAYRERIEQGPPDIQQRIDSVYAEIQARIDAIDNEFSIKYELSLRPEVKERIDRATWSRPEEQVSDKPTRRYALDRSKKFGVFYSNLAKQLVGIQESGGKKDPKAPWLRAQLTKKGVTEDDLFWAGFDEFVAENATDAEGRINIDALLEGLETFEVMEELLGHGGQRAASDIQVDEGDSQSSAEWESDEEVRARHEIGEDVPIEDWMYDYQTTFYVDSGTDEDYSDPYTFTLMHDLDGEAYSLNADEDGMALDINDIQSSIVEWVENRQAQELEGEGQIPSENVMHSSESWKLSGGRNYGESLIHLPDFDIEGGHYDGNVVVHGRFQDFASREYPRIFHIDEIQADHHQRGRREGYAGPLPDQGLGPGIVDASLLSSEEVFEGNAPPPVEVSYIKVIKTNDEIEDNDKHFEAKFISGWKGLDLQTLTEGGILLGTVHFTGEGYIFLADGALSAFYGKLMRDVIGPKGTEELAVAMKGDGPINTKFDPSTPYETTVVPVDHKLDIVGMVREVNDSRGGARGSRAFRVRDGDGNIVPNYNAITSASTEAGTKLAGLDQIFFANDSISAESKAAGAISKKWWEDRKDKLEDAPFKKDWHELMAKRLLYRAIVEGHQGISWTTAVQQVERYSDGVRAVVDEIRYSEWKEQDNRQDGGSEEMRQVFLDKDGGHVMNFSITREGIIVKGSHPDLIGKPLSAVIGGKLAKEVLGNDVSTTGDSQAYLGGKVGTIEGEEILVGGQLYEDLYDKRLVKFFKSIANKFGVKVTKEKIGPAGVVNRRIKKYDVFQGKEIKDYAGDFPEYYYLVDEENVMLPGGYGSLDHASMEARKLNDPVRLHTVHFMPINEEMRESIKEEGLPLSGRRFAVDRDARNTGYDSNPNPPDRRELATPFWKQDLPDTVKRGDGTTNLSKQTFGGIQYHYDGSRLPKRYNEGRGIPLVVPFGKYFAKSEGSDPSGYGERKILAKHASDFPSKTIPEHETYQHAIKGLVTALSDKYKNKQDTSGNISIHTIEDEARLIVLWDDPEFSSPVIAVLDYKRAGDGLSWLPDRYELVSIYSKDTFNEENLPRSKWNSPKHGQNTSVRALRIFSDFNEYRRPDAVRAMEAKVNVERPYRDRRFAVNRSTIYNTPAQQSAINHFMGGVRTDRSFIGNIIAGMMVNVDPDRISKFRTAYLDKYHRMFEVGKSAEQKRREGGKLGINIKEMASVSAHAMGLLTSRGGALTEAALKYGFIKFTKLKDGEDYEGTALVEDQELTNTSTDTVYYDKSTGEFRKGSFTVEGLYDGTGGLQVILARIGSKDNNLLPRFWAYSRALRIKNLLEDRPGIRVPMGEIEEATGKKGEEAIKEALAFAKENPEIAVAHQNLRNFNEGMVQFLVDTQAIDQKMSDIWLENADYIPFYLNLDGKMTDEMRELFRRKLGSKADFMILNSLIPQLPKKLKGHDGATMDPTESLVSNTNALITAGLKNLASRRAIRDMLEVETAVRQGGQFGGEDVVRVFENGKPVYYEVADPMYFDTLVGMWDGKNPAIGALQSFGVKGAQLLREGVTHMPDFIVANTTRDALLTWINHGISGDRTPLFELANSFKRLTTETIARQKGNIPSKTYKALEVGGALGGIELKDVRDDKIVKSFNRGVNDVAGLLKKTWNLLGDMSQSAEAAARERIQEGVYNSVRKELIDQGMDPDEASRHAMGEASFQAMEILNFSRHGANATLRLFTSVIPFLNARIQGFDVFARNSLVGENVHRRDSKAAKAALWQRGLLISGATVIYTLMSWDDDDYKTRPLHERENNWIFRIGPYALAVPIPFEAGIVFKAIPEHAVRLMMGETSSELLEAASHHMTATMQFNPIPQVAKPLLETAMNKSFFYEGDIIPPNLKGLAPEHQYRTSTSAGSRMLEKLIPDWVPVVGKVANPLMIENLIRGYFGSAGTVALGFSDIILHRPLFGFTERPTKMWSEQPILKRFIKNEIGTGNEAAFYKLKEESDAAVRTINLLAKRRDPKALSKYRKEAAGILRIRGWVNQANTQMKNIRTALVANEYSDRSPDEKQRRRNMLREQRSQLTSKAVDLRRELDSY